MASVRERVDFYYMRVAPDAAGMIAQRIIPPGAMGRRQGERKLVFSSMMSGHDHSLPGRGLPEKIEREAEVLFEHIRQFMESTGGTLDDLTNINLMVMDDAYRAAAQHEVERMFPDPNKRPAYHILNVAPSGLRGERIQATIAGSIAG
ncbi:MAG: endoribonuclease [Chloroflexi bacterium]|nr:endoribonuclease [Chloroflexota bacterium]